MVPVSTTLAHNRELSAIFRQMARAYAYLGPEQRFRANAYNNASKVLANMEEPVDALSPDMQKLEDIPAIGESIAQKIVEYLSTGKIETFQKLKQRVPAGLLHLMEVEGFGPATVRLLHERLGIMDSTQLEAAIRQGKLKGIKGIGTKKEAQMRRALKMEDIKNRIPLSVAVEVGSMILKEVEGLPGVQRATIAGSIRRKLSTVGDIDLVISAPRKYRKKIAGFISKLQAVTRIIAAGDTKVSVLVQPDDIQVDVRIVHPEEYGAAMLYFTGNKEHNIQLRTLARQHGWKINEYGVFDLATGRRLAGETEESIYALLNFPFIPPEKRLGTTELQQKRKR